MSPPSRPKRDASVEHFAWLVDGRSDNQSVTLELYKIIEENRIAIENKPLVQSISQELTGVAFSLWRAVFLSDTTEEHADSRADLKDFLSNLIGDNTVLYITDRNARNWSFRYYLDNATYRLRRLATENSNLLSLDEFSSDAQSDKDEWLAAQRLLRTTIDRFRDYVVELHRSDEI